MMLYATQRIEDEAPGLGSLSERDRQIIQLAQRKIRNTRVDFDQAVRSVDAV